ncbi:MAG: hypothetical protein AABZ06_12875 [Bdellovibrionota bacterium]
MRCLIVIAAVILIFASGCATLSNRNKTLMAMGLTGAAAGTVGAILAADGENKLAHGALWGGVGAATTAALSLFIFDEEAKRKEAELKATKFEKELAAFRDDNTPELVGSNRIGLEKPLPGRFQHLITPGQWSLYKVDRWVTFGESELVHQDFIFRFSQPQLNPSAKLKESNESQGGK